MRADEISSIKDLIEKNKPVTVLPKYEAFNKLFMTCPSQHPLFQIRFFRQKKL
jgi:hypothetical protein